MLFNSLTTKIYFIGIGGIGMSGLAEILLKLGHKVYGSDLNKGDRVDKLIAQEVVFFNSHNGENISSIKPDVVVYTSAVDLKTNPEILCALKNKIPVLSRAEMLAELMRFKRTIAVAGSHGKTTTTALTGNVFTHNKFDATVVVGGVFQDTDSNVSVGAGKWLLAEADESDGSFLKYQPEILVVTNIDKEHSSHYGDFDKLLDSFVKFIHKLPFYGTAILCSDCDNVFSLLPKLNRKVLTYGFNDQRKPDFLIQKKLATSGKIIYSIKSKCKYFTDKNIAVTIPGDHNISNAVASLVIGKIIGLDLDLSLKSLVEFKGVKRRFEFKGSLSNAVPIIEDYAHHPTEIKAVIQASLDQYGSSNKPLVIFQPHRHSRSRELWSEFSKCFTGASKVFILPTYIASEKYQDWFQSFSSVPMCENINTFVPSVYCQDFEVLLLELKKGMKEFNQGPILFLGAGDINKLIPMLFSELKNNPIKNDCSQIHSN